MSMRCSVRRQARQDLEDIAAYLIEHSRGGVDSALRVVEAIEETFERIARTPGGSSVLELPPGVESPPFELRRRVVTRYSDYVVFYTLEGEQVEILSVLHGAQDWPSILFGDKTHDHET
ncbi:MAG: type II toxin-antitoxin system RelE/ParE family toxin [Myxococcales bacterium FL481]|nr:MAG: type II toxin-antitoxin system RelE/ParE family toxin [Myxococcales bacterium FL481]